MVVRAKIVVAVITPSAHSKVVTSSHFGTTPSQIVIVSVVVIIVSTVIVAVVIPVPVTVVPVVISTDAAVAVHVVIVVVVVVTTPVVVVVVIVVTPIITAIPIVSVQITIPLVIIVVIVVIVAVVAGATTHLAVEIAFVIPHVSTRHGSLQHVLEVIHSFVQIIHLSAPVSAFQTDIISASYPVVQRVIRRREQCMA